MEQTTTPAFEDTYLIIIVVWSTSGLGMSSISTRRLARPNPAIHLINPICYQTE